MKIPGMQNEPHTRDLYEISREMPPGQLARNWLWEMAAFVKSVDSNHMVSILLMLLALATQLSIGKISILQR